MGAQQLFEHAFVYVATAVVAVPLAKRLGLGSEAALRGPATMRHDRKEYWSRARNYRPPRSSW